MKLMSEFLAAEQGPKIKLNGSEVVAAKRNNGYQYFLKEKY
jgi:hypothetical protein